MMESLWGRCSRVSLWVLVVVAPSSCNLGSCNSAGSSFGGGGAFSAAAAAARAAAVARRGGGGGGDGGQSPPPPPPPASGGLGSSPAQYERDGTTSWQRQQQGQPQAPQGHEYHQQDKEHQGETNGRRGWGFGGSGPAKWDTAANFEQRGDVEHGYSPPPPPPPPSGRRDGDSSSECDNQSAADAQWHNRNSNRDDGDYNGNSGSNQWGKRPPQPPPEPRYSQQQQQQQARQWEWEGANFMQQQQHQPPPKGWEGFGSGAGAGAGAGEGGEGGAPAGDAHVPQYGAVGGGLGTAASVRNQQQQQQQPVGDLPPPGGDLPGLPAGASVGAVTPEITLRQYRSGGAATASGAPGVAGAAGVPDVEAQVAQMRNLDKELVCEGLKKAYRKKILPLEESSKFQLFNSPPLNPADFEAKPMVLIVGQYSVGKTSFIRSLLQKDFPGQRVGPEPTTDRFVAVSYGEDEGVMPGHALAMQQDMPFRSLQQFGNNFLTKFEGSIVNAPILRNITLVDTPGVLSGEKQRIGRDYDFSSVISWFAERADLIIVMFDAHKLDISDELKMVIDTLKPHHDKMRVLLNKADTIDTQQLMRVYGALMWSLGKVMQTPEVCRVYIGSFWEAPLSNAENRLLLEREKGDLLEELMRLPENAVIRRINELVKRARTVKVHAYIIHYLRKQMPYMMGKSEKQAKLVSRLDQEFLACARRYGLPLGDFPKVDKFRRSLREVKDISKFQKLDKGLVHEMDKVFSIDIPRLMEKAQQN